MGNALIITLVIGICLVLSFVFSGMEAGVLALSRLRIRQLVRAGDRRARVLQRFLEQPEDFLWTILVGNTLASFLAVGLVLVLLDGWLGDQGVWLVASFLVLMFSYYTFFELLPKMLFRALPNRLCLALATPFQLIHVTLSPLVAAMTGLARGMSRWTGGKAFRGHLFGSREEMRLVMQESAQGLTSEERLMINRVLDLQNLTVQQITTPLDQAAMVSTSTPLGDALRLAQEKRVSRLPVWRQTAGQRRIVGVLSLRTLLYEAALDRDRPVENYLKPALYLEEGLLLDAALHRMRRSGQRLAIVLGPNQREVGIVSLQDILKVIFGEIRL